MKPLRDIIRYQVVDQIWCTLWEQPWYNSWDQVVDQVGYQTDIRVGDQIEREL